MMAAHSGDGALLASVASQNEMVLTARTTRLETAAHFCQVVVLKSPSAGSYLRLIDFPLVFQAHRLVFKAHILCTSEQAMQQLMTDHAANFKAINSPDINAFYQKERPVFTPSVRPYFFLITLKPRVE